MRLLERTLVLVEIAVGMTLACDGGSGSPAPANRPATVAARQGPHIVRAPAKPAAGKFLISTASVDVSCSGPSDCTTAASNLACATSLGCVNNVCKFAVASSNTCPCYQNDIRWCSNFAQVQF